MLKKYYFVIAIFILLFASSLYGNNLSISNVTNTNPGLPNPQISFVISWDNSWYVNNGTDDVWDAIWIIVKYQNVPTTTPNCESLLKWEHSLMSSASTDFAIGYPLEIVRVADNRGVFIKRENPGTGTVQPTTATITLNLGAGTYNFSVVGIEMAYVPAGAFNLGDGASTNTFSSLNIASENLIIGGAAGGGIQADIPATYPKGYNAFYCMKYEISQKQYVEFLNLLTYDQQTTRTSVAPSSDPGLTGVCAMVTNCTNRNGIKIIDKGINPTRSALYGNDLVTAPGDAFNSANDGLSIASNFLKWSDLLAYLDWACLRPITNLEFEKVARGKEARLANEYIWGSTLITQAVSNDLTDAGLATETSNSTGNQGLCAYGAAVDKGPLRVGFPATSTSTRSTAGAAYYGVQNLGGNLWEMVSGGNNAGGLGYKITSASTDIGDGTLTPTGEADIPNWQASPSVVGACNMWHMEMRGGSFKSANTTVRTSDRSQNSVLCGGVAPYGFGNDVDQRLSDVGGRGVR